jgi:prepilin-type N-terminal cleavage/methylation domain-containing protein
MINKLRVRAQSESGFTLVELLVVMLILGLLAAIAIPSFFNQRDKAKDADAKEAVRTAQTAIETYATDHGGVYNNPAPDAADLVEIEPSLGNATISDVQAPDAKSYSVTVDSEVAGQTFTISRSNTGILDSDCTVEGDAGCPEGGDWAANGDPD